MPYRLNKSKPLVAAFTIALLLICAARLSAQNGTPSSAAPPTREVVDEAGRTVRIPLSPARIISLAPSLTETIYALGLQDRLVGDTDYCNYPADAQKKTKVGGGINPNLEIIVSLHPDLVLVTNTFNRMDTVRALEDLGIPSYDVDPHTVDEIITSTKKLADILGAPESGKSLADELQGRLAILKTKVDSILPTRVLFVVWTEPLMSVGKGTFVADALRKAGAKSIVDSAKDWPTMNLEEVVRLQPDFLVFPETHSQEGSHDFETLALKPGWRLLDAVHNHHYAVVSDAIIHPSPRIVSVIEDLARQLHASASQESPGMEKPVIPPNRMNALPTDSLSQDVSLLDALPSQELSCAR